MTDRLALAAYLATHRIKLVHTWQTFGRWNAMMETADQHTTGVGETQVSAVLAGLSHLGHSGFRTRLYLLERVL